MYSQTFLVTSVRGSVDLPQIAASSVLSFFGAAAIFLPLAALPAAFFVALSVAFVAFVIVGFFVFVVVVATVVFVVVVIAIEEVQTRLSLE